jgi:hypothetical protein
VCEIKPKAAVDDAESDDDTPKPDMSVRPEGTALVLLEETMVHVTKNWLEEDQDEKHNANDRMSLIELLKSVQNRDHISCCIDIPCESVWQDRYQFQMPQ